MPHVGPRRVVHDFKPSFKLIPCLRTMYLMIKGYMLSSNEWKIGRNWTGPNLGTSPDQEGAIRPKKSRQDGCNLTPPVASISVTCALGFLLTNHGLSKRLSQFIFD